MTDDVAGVVAAYCGAWLETDGAARRALLDRAWGDGATYQDPTADVTGRDALDAHIAGFHAHAPGARILITSAVDSHHGQLRFTWKMVGADGAVVVEGIDFGELGADGRLARIVGFFGPLSPVT
ncbi:MAG: nuclear transport factor 2 family protein [Hyphomicrobiales bacterium]|nr:nuclear transport factor 2 family protein [Hyphomicrobiales bacterium]MCP5372117.1 nuclear transport factor 2 family protein [Hyphomicrobiales bacterium]